MSWKASGYVKGLTGGMTRSEKLLMLILSDYYNDSQGYAWPTVIELARDAMLSERQVYSLIQSLAKKGLLEVDSGRATRSSNRYSFPGYGTRPEITAPEAHFRSDLKSHVRVTVREPSAEEERARIQTWHEWWGRVSTGHPFPTTPALINPDSYFTQAGPPPPVVDSQHWDCLVRSVEAARKDYLLINSFRPLVIPTPAAVKFLLPVADLFYSTDSNLGRIVAGIQALGPIMPDWSDALVEAAKNTGDFSYAITAWQPDMTPADERTTDFG